LPILGSALVLVLPSSKTHIIRWFSIFIAAIELVISLFLYLGFNKHLPNYQFFELHDWITINLGEFGKLSLDYCVGVDGISLPLVLLSSIVFVIAFLASNIISEKQKGYYSMLLLMLGTVMGCFVALDFFLFFLFFEFMLLPMYFLIGIWGGPRKDYAAIKFFLYTLFGSVLILVVLIALYTSAYEPDETAHSFTMNIFQYLLNSKEVPQKEFVHTLRFDHLSDPHNYINGSLLHVNNSEEILGFSYRQWAFLFLLIGFAIKLPAVPFHTWLPDAHVEAPTPVSVVLAAVLLKIGAYGLIRIAYPVFTHEAVGFAYLVGTIGVVSIIYGGYNALAQQDLKKMIAYSSISHMGFVLLGMASYTAEGVSGTLYQLVSHGFISAALFLIAGVIYDRTHNRLITNFQGLANKMPYFTFFVVISFFASLGLPGFSGFISEILVFLGAFKSLLLPKWMAIVATLGLVISASYYLWTLQRMFFGKFWINESISSVQDISDLTLQEKINLTVLTLFIVALGIFPSLLTELFNATINDYLGLK
jgi:NADH-quinone oxidoreductase subunit M